MRVSLPSKQGATSGSGASEWILSIDLVKKGAAGAGQVHRGRRDLAQSADMVAADRPGRRRQARVARVQRDIRRPGRLKSGGSESRGVTGAGFRLTAAFLRMGRSPHRRDPLRLPVRVEKLSSSVWWPYQLAIIFHRSVAEDPLWVHRVPALVQPPAGEGVADEVRMHRMVMRADAARSWTTVSTLRAAIGP